MIIDSDGSEYDWLLGYDPPPDNFQARLEKALRGEDTYKSISAAYTKNPKNIDVVFKLARKYDDRFDQTRAAEKYREVIALDPEGKVGSYTTEYTKATVPYTQYAEFAIATSNLFSEKPDLEPAKAFLQKYPESKLVKETYDQIARYYGYQAPKEEAAKFFPEYASKFPNDARVLDAWLARIVRDKEPLDKGAELVAGIGELTRDNPLADVNADIADFYILKGEKAKADEVYGKDFMEDKVNRFAFDLVGYANFWLANNSNQESAVAMAETALKLRPEDTWILQQVAAAYVKTGQDDKALAIFGPEYIKSNSDDTNSLYGYARFWAGQGKNLDSALEAAKKSVELKPGVFFAWSTLSDVQLKLKNYPEALKAAEKAYELAEDYAKKGIQAKIERIKKEQGEEKK
jgi:tetratricopeptide (TPR) repeat protein